MNSALLALFTRALREDVRSKSMYWARAGLVGIVLLNLATTQIAMGWGGAPGLVFFKSIIKINFMFILLAGLSYFASAITEEKEDMTLGLLRMTNLNPLSILLGKSASRQVGALLLLVSQVPFTVLAVALGGVTLAQIIAAYACLAAFTVFLGNVALFFSVMVRRTYAAALLTFCTIFVFLFGAWIVRYPVLYTLALFKIIPAELPPEWLATFLARWESASPFAHFAVIGITGFRDGPLSFQVVSNVLLGLAFFFAAWAVFDIFCSEEKDAGPARASLTRGGNRARIFITRRPWSAALLWKDYYFLGGGHLGTFIKFAVYALLFAGSAYATYRFNNSLNDLGGATLFIAALVVALEVAFIAARVFRQERMWKTWSGLAMLPMSTRRIAYQKIAGCLLAMWPGVFFAGLGFALLIYDAIRRDLPRGDFVSSSDFQLEALAGMAFAALLVIYFYHLIVTLSLRLKWGALPLSIAITLVGTNISVLLAFLMFKDAAFIILDFVLICAIGTMHYNIGSRLEAIAAEE